MKRKANVIEFPNIDYSKTKRNKTKENFHLNRVIYRDPWFYHEKNMDMQINAMHESMNISMYPSVMTYTNSTMPTKFSTDNAFPNIVNEDKERKKEKESKVRKFKKVPLKEKLILKKIFPDKDFLDKRQRTINNKFNLVYAENEEDYERKIEKKNNIRRKIGKPEIHQNNSRQIYAKMNQTMKRIIFMKGINDYIFPGVVMEKMHQLNNQLRHHSKELNMFTIPKNQRDFDKSKRNSQRKEYLSESIEILSNNNNLLLLK